MSHNVLVVPDVHGRSFWRDAMSFRGPIVFLGDYHDPYPSDFTPEDAEEPVEEYLQQSIDNLKELFQFAEENQDRVTLLIGNHDLEYLCMSVDAYRMDYDHLDQLMEIYDQYGHLFRGCKIIGKTIFTHAGICREWYDELMTSYPNLSKSGIELNVDAAILNFLPCVKEASASRGGVRDHGGPLWMDYTELQEGTATILDRSHYQIVGHTQQYETGGRVQGGGWSCIDSRRIFVVNPRKPATTLKVWEGVKS